MYYIDIFLQHYGFQGAALATVIICLFGVQLYYFTVAYARIPRYKDSARPRVAESEPPVSVIVPMFSEDASFVEQTLPLLFAQEYHTFEIVVVYIGHDLDFYADLARISQMRPNLVTTRIDFSPRFPISPKMAINVGIKTAHYEHLILTSNEAAPRSEKWLSLMAKGFTRGDIVLGYCAMEQTGTFVNSLMRTHFLMQSVRWIAQAVVRKPYRGTRNNLGFTKSLYFGVKGFDHLNMNIGEDDLFVQQIATATNTSIVLSPRATVEEKCWGGFNWWINRMHYYGSAVQFYPRRARTFVQWEVGSRLLLLGAVAVAVAVMPLEYKIAAVAVLLLRYLLVSLTLLRICRRVGETHIAGRFFIYDIIEPFVHIMMWAVLKRKDPKVWR